MSGHAMPIQQVVEEVPGCMLLIRVHCGDKTRVLGPDGVFTDHLVMVIRAWMNHRYCFFGIVSSFTGANRDPYASNGPLISILGKMKKNSQ